MLWSKGRRVGYVVPCGTSAGVPGRLLPGFQGAQFQGRFEGRIQRNPGAYWDCPRCGDSGCHESPINRASGLWISPQATRPASRSCTRGEACKHSERRFPSSVRRASQFRPHAAGWWVHRRYLPGRARECVPLCRVPASSGTAPGMRSRLQPSIWRYSPGRIAGRAPQPPGGG